MSGPKAGLVGFLEVAGHLLDVHNREGIMTLRAMKHTVQLLHDARGIYGVGLSVSDTKHEMRVEAAMVTAN
jgi:hypothetical protein